MRRLDEGPLDPDIEEELDAVDAALAGHPVDPRHAELIELALLVAVERPGVSGEFAATLDAKIACRFASGARQPIVRSRRRWWPALPTLGALAAAALALTFILPGGAAETSSSGTSAGQTAGPAAAAGVASGHLTPANAPVLGTPSPVKAPPAGRFSGNSFGTSSGDGTNGSSGSLSSPPLRLPANGRKNITGAQLELSTRPSDIDGVAQQVYDVMGRENGIVMRATVTAAGAADAYAQFQLSVPSPTLPQVMAELSRLRGATVLSRTDNVQDVTDQYSADVRRLGDARALRTSLLRRLAQATTQTAIDSLTAQLHDAEASIASDTATLKGLEHQVGFSQIQLTIQPAAVHAPVPVPDHGGFTLSRATHDAARVLTVAAGVTLVALAALVPVALLAALLLWIAAALRRRARERALDLA